jgi:hypothetical protein
MIPNSPTASAASHSNFFHRKRSENGIRSCTSGTVGHSLLDNFMKQCGYFHAMVAVFLIMTTLAIPAFSAVKAVPKPNVDLHKHPTGEKTPIEISVGLYITNFVAIDESRESFEVGGYLTGKWQDPRLALPADQVADKGTEQTLTRTFRLEDLWTPAIEAANSVSHKTNQYSLVADRDGSVTYIERFDAILSNDYDLKRFPFDTQVLQFEFQPFLSTAAEIRFAPQPLPSTGISPEQHTQLAAWQINDLRYTAEKVARDRYLPLAQEAVFQLVVKRRSGFYLWKIFVPLAMMTLVPMVIFWIDVEQFDWLLKVPMTMLLSMVAFEFTITRDLPRVGYVTFLDAVFLASFALCFLCIFEITTVYLLQKRGMRTTAVTVHSAGRWIYPMAYLGVILFLAAIFLA